MHPTTNMQQYWPQDEVAKNELVRYRIHLHFNTVGLSSEFSVPGFTLHVSTETVTSA